jgi:hypothetical protein
MDTPLLWHIPLSHFNEKVRRLGLAGRAARLRSLAAFMEVAQSIPDFATLNPGYSLCAPPETTNGDGFRYGGKKRSLCWAILDYPSHMSSIAIGGFATQTRKGIQMSKTEDNKAIVGRWFTEFWGKTCNLGVVDCSIPCTSRAAAVTISRHS